KDFYAKRKVLLYTKTISPGESYRRFSYFFTNLERDKMKKGFTLIELLIVVAIIAILAAIAVPNFLEAQTRAKISRVVSDLRTINTGFETYRIDHGNIPPHGMF